MRKQRKHLRPDEAERSGFLTRTQLKARKLMPGASTFPAGSVWQGYRSYPVYRPEDCIPWKSTPGPSQRRRMDCSAQARTLLEEGCIIIDTETTGLGDRDEIIEIAAIDETGATLLETTLCPVTTISEEALEVHGLTVADVAESPVWPEIHAKVEALFSEGTVVAYNAPFDLRLLSQTAQVHGEALSAPVSGICAMRLFSRWMGSESASGGFRWVSLGEAAAYCGYTPDRAHRALSDCRSVLAVLQYLAARKSGRL
ncbi:3'-5' exonuclease [Marinobacter sp. G11]|uniref:3'-5' exonuclease n=1 Tax=Marinobacter sp. G11 TaxID=2903522 RepID=UPI001E40E20D|nr:3'-5' exonuclease [Marinobacter sp. G11]MCE0759437.1 3'-5' exonuclease [Marinobacter sp. G11]